MIVKSRLPGIWQGWVFPDLALLVVDENVPPDVETQLRVEAQAGIDGDWDAAPHAAVPQPRLKLIDGGGPVPDCDAS